MESGFNDLQLDTNGARNLTERVFKLSGLPIGDGGLGYIWKDANGDQWVAIKKVRIHATGIAEAPS